jgi:Fe(3+) dicitrate transport protein
MFPTRPAALHNQDLPPRLRAWLLASTMSFMPFPAPALAQEQSAEATADGRPDSAIIVIGQRESLLNIPGSGAIVTEQDLELARVFTVNEALRQAPGVFVREEEGLGMRPNIGIRGLNPTRSSKVLLLEDGIPLAFAPYGDNASYYHPPIDRFSRIEILKGASQIRFGPQTIGGVINYITPAAPAEATGQFTLSGGSRDYLEFDAQGGAPMLGGRWLLHANHKESDGSRKNQNLKLTDIYVKAEYDLGDTQSLKLSASRFAEGSQISYSGLTRAEFAADPRGNPFRNDSFETERWSGTLARLRRLLIIIISTAIGGANLPIPVSAQMMQVIPRVAG